MISDEKTLRTFTLRPGVAQLTAIAEALHRIPIRVVRYAAARLRKAPADFEPDPFGTQPPFLSDFWPGC